MLKKLFILTVLVFIPLTVNAELYVDAKNQIQFEVPQGWKVFSDRDKADHKLSMGFIYLTKKTR